MNLFKSTTGLFFLLLMLNIPLNTSHLIKQDLDSHYCIITLTNDKYTNNNKPLTLIVSNVFEAPLTETPYSIKVDESVKRQIRWQYFVYLYKNHKAALEVFRGKFRESSLWIHINASKENVEQTVTRNFTGRAYENHSKITAENFRFNKNEKKDPKEIMNTFKTYFTEGKPIQL